MTTTKPVLEKIWNQVPVDYYQSGVKQNVFQRMWHTGKLRAILSLVDAKPDTILDVGCASGWFLSQIYKKYPKSTCYGIDVYERAIAYGSKRYKKLVLKTSDGHDIPYKDKTFDVVICSEVLEHVKDPERVLREIHRVLKDDGSAIIEMDTGNMLFRIIWYWWTNLRHGVWEDAHIQEFTRNKLEDMILDNGYYIEKEKTFNMTMAVAFKARKVPNSLRK